MDQVMVIFSFVAGLSFFVMGLTVALCPKKGSDLRVAEHLYLLAGFGLLHGLSEWLHVFSQVGAFADAGVLVLARAFTLPVSFVCLVHFAARAIPACRRRFNWLRFATPALWMVWLAVFLAGVRNLPMWNLWSHCVLGVPGALLAGWALALQLSQVKKAYSLAPLGGLRIAAWSLVCYAILTGIEGVAFMPASLVNVSLFSERAAIPIQALRVVCGLTLAYGVVRVLGFFHWETQNRINRLEAECRQRDADITRLRQVAAFGEMSETMARQVEEPLGVVRIFMQRLLVGFNQHASAEDLRGHVREGLSEIDRAEGIIRTFREQAGLAPVFHAAADERDGRNGPEYAAEKAAPKQDTSDESDDCRDRLANPDIAQII